MKTFPFYLALIACLLTVTADAYPPAPHYQIYGTVRDEQGSHLVTSEGEVILSGVYAAYGAASVFGGGVTGGTILNGGVGFISAPTVTFSSDTGSGAAGMAVLTDGVVTGVTITQSGSGYGSAVTIGFSGGGAAPLEIVRSTTDQAIAPAINYSLSVPMDSGTFAQLYDVSAMRPLLPFTIRVVIGGVNYVPIQIAAATSPLWTDKINSQNSPSISTAGNYWAVGLPAGKLRLDLWLGVDSNGDGLPDAWQWEVVNSDTTGKLTDFTQVDPHADLSGNGMSNMSKFLTGVYALELQDGLHFEVDSVTDGIAKLRFQAITGRTYHISSSTDLQTWTKPQPFSLEIDGTNVQSYYLADSSKILNIYVPQGNSVQHFYQLYVE
jgi:hypothetical protein